MVDNSIGAAGSRVLEQFRAQQSVSTTQQQAQQRPEPTPIAGSGNAVPGIPDVPSRRSAENTAVVQGTSTVPPAPPVDSVSVSQTAIDRLNAESAGREANVSSGETGLGPISAGQSSATEPLSPAARLQQDIDALLGEQRGQTAVGTASENATDVPEVRRSLSDVVAERLRDPAGQRPPEQRAGEQSQTSEVTAGVSTGGDNQRRVTNL